MALHRYLDPVSYKLGFYGYYRKYDCGFGGHVLGLLPPDARAPEGAIQVDPSPGAHIVHTA